MSEYGQKEMEIAEAVKSAARQTVKQAFELGVRRLREEQNFDDKVARTSARIILRQLIDEN